MPPTFDEPALQTRKMVCGALVHGTIPMFTALLGWFVGKVKLPRRLWYGLLLIQLGIAVVLLDAGHAGTWPQGMGDLSLLMAGLC
ncbi:MAG: hypothetical protein AB7E12_12135 [Burkholderiaceae bacterium]